MCMDIIHLSTSINYRLFYVYSCKTGLHCTFFCLLAELNEQRLLPLNERKHIQSVNKQLLVVRLVASLLLVS